MGGSGVSRPRGGLLSRTHSSQHSLSVVLPSLPPNTPSSPLIQPDLESHDSPLSFSLHWYQTLSPLLFSKRQIPLNFPMLNDKIHPPTHSAEKLPSLPSLQKSISEGYACTPQGIPSTPAPENFPTARHPSTFVSTTPRGENIRSLREARTHSSKGRKSTLRPWRSRKTKKKMVLGADIDLEDSVTMALCTLVGRLSYRHLCRTDLADWVCSNWHPLLGYEPEISYLPRGWLSFQFNSVEDASHILERIWVIDRASLMLKRWRVNFEPSQDYFRL
jgi:hypothetical protein